VCGALARVRPDRELTFRGFPSPHSDTLALNTEAPEVGFAALSQNMAKRAGATALLPCRKRETAADPLTRRGHAAEEMDRPPTRLMLGGATMPSNLSRASGTGEAFAARLDLAHLPADRRRRKDSGHDQTHAAVVGDWEGGVICFLGGGGGTAREMKPRRSLRALSGGQRGGHASWCGATAERRAAMDRLPPSRRFAAISRK